MLIRSKTIFLPVILILLTGIFFFVKYQGPHIVEDLYANASFDILNKMTSGEGTQGLDFYAGKAEEVCLGPLQFVLSGIILLILSLAYLRQSRPFIFGLVVGLYFVITRFEILFNPPYGEAIIGHFSDAIWLARHSFDYAGYFQLEGVATGGPQHYPTSIYPSLLALLIKATPSAKVLLFINHLLVFMMSASIIVLFREILKKFLANNLALLGSLALLALPLFQSMTEILNLEIPCVFFAVLSTYFLIKKQLAWASLTAILSVFMKAPGAIACANVLFASILLACYGNKDKKHNFKNILWGISALAFAGAKAVARSRIIGQQPLHNTVKFLAGWPNIKQMPVLWIFLTTLVILIANIVIKRRTYKHTSSPVRALIKDNYAAMIMSGMGILWFLLYLNFSVMGYRYELLLAPYFVFAIIYALTIIVRNQKIVERGITLMILVSLAGSFGLFYKEKIESSIYSFNHLERSLEYRNDLKLDVQIAKYIEDNYSKLTIGAPFVIAQSLVLPEIGYVKKALGDVVIYGEKANQEGLRAFTGLEYIDIRNTIWIGFFKNHISDDIKYPIGDTDRIIKEFTVGDKRAAAFIGGAVIDAVWRALMVEYYKHAQ